MKPTVINAEFQVTTATVTVERVTFLIYFTNDDFYPVNEYIRVKRPDVPDWKGEVMVFRQAVWGKKVVNWRSDREGVLAWKVINQYVGCISHSDTSDGEQVPR
jgi:hypothetical protein